MKLNTMLQKCWAHKRQKNASNRWKKNDLKSTLNAERLTPEQTSDILLTSFTRILLQRCHCKWTINYRTSLFVPFVWGCLQVQQSMNWPSMTSNHVLSIRLCCWEITQGIGKSYEIPRITTAHLSQSNYFVYVAADLHSSSLSLDSFPEVNTLLFLTTHSVTCTWMRLYPCKI